MIVRAPHGRHEASATANLFGILYAEDFDDLPEASSSSSKAMEPAPDVITQADLDSACAAAVRAARLDWQVAQEQTRLSAITSLGAALAGLRDANEQSAMAITEGTVSTMLSILSSLLPHFCREHGPAEVRSLLGRLLPTIRSPTRITVRVHPDLVPLIQCDVAELEPDLAALIDVLAAPLERGDVKVSWENGAMARDSAQIVQSIEDALGQLGLHQKIEVPAKRRMAYAD